ncbi:STAS domain-containing protein [Nocardia sp. NPDC127579]|uniref:STAS domain-containing protein n=1 Tax=Nocardia sp. NPDC127579 TaxID=3345402 RepID=UPI0036321E78
MPTDAVALHPPVDTPESARYSGTTQRISTGHLSTQHVRHRRHCVVLRVAGELDAAGYPAFRAGLDNAIDAGAPAVVVDLRAARFVSLRAAAGLGAARQRAACSGVDIRLVTDRRDIERALEVTGVRPMFASYPSMRAALDA